ncbi:GNAT family N-acetyltransferase [Leuconostocaceae bacterium ESL0958]|nr:GNAT family N-acetyltransferase [Leuconostocaceae bacterium ESL0958]
MWQDQNFEGLTTRDLYQIYRLRSAVFVVEQKRLYQDIDETDLTARHIFYEEDGQVLAYGRVFLLADGQVSFGRVVTAAAARGRGLGAELVRRLLASIQRHYPERTVLIESQEQVTGLYARFGFMSQGAPFMHAGSPHVRMTHAGFKAE